MRLICFLIFIISFTAPACDFLHAQDSRNTEINESEKVVRSVRFSGNRNVKDRTLKTLVRTRNNREFLGIPRFTPWYFIYQVFGVGESPALLDQQQLENDVERIRLFYENLGFFEAEIEANVVEYKKNRLEVSFIITEGPVSIINRVSYTGMPKFDEPEAVDEFFNESIFISQMENDSTFLVDRPYRLRQLREEQTRVINFLKDRGYAAVIRDSVTAFVKRDTLNTQQLDILYSIQPGDKFTFGDVFITLAGPGGSNLTYDQEKVVNMSPTAQNGTKITIQKQEDAQTRFSLLEEQIKFKPGEIFNQSNYLQSVNEFQNLGMLIVNRFGLSEQGAQIQDLTDSQIPVFFELETLPKHSIQSEFFGMRRFGFGTGVGVNYNNNNTFGRAENLTVGVNGNFEFVTSRTLNEISPRDSLGNRNTTGSTIFQSFEVRTEYALPRLNWPFRVFQSKPWVTRGRTLYTLRYSQSDQLFFDINSDVRFNLRYEVTHNPQFTSLLDLIEVNIVDTDPSSQFRNNLVNEFGEGSFEFLRISEDFRPQISSIIRYTLRSRNTDMIKRDFGHFSEFTASLGGNIPYLLDRFLIDPGNVDGKIPSPFGISTNNLTYSRFAKFSADYRRYFSVTPETVFAFRLFGGYIQTIGQSTTVPLNRRFFAGGSNDIRGWNAFRLGPGSISPDEVAIPGGEVKLASFTELRQVFLRNVLSADWQLALFTDAGNVWYGPRNSFRDEDNVDILRDGRFFIDDFFNQIAVGSGFGLRFDWEFVVARFDFAFRIHDLQKGWFKDDILYFSFGIGHSF